MSLFTQNRQPYVGRKWGTLTDLWGDPVHRISQLWYPKYGFNPCAKHFKTTISIINKDIECLFIEIELNGDKIHVGIIYRTPDADVRNFCDYLVNILESLKPHNQSCYLIGDYNIDLLKHSTHNPTSEFLDLMFSNSFIPPINKPTRVTHKTATLIDNIFTNIYKHENKYLTGILTTDISDHYIIFHIAPSQFSQQKDHHQLIRLINSSNLEKYTTAIQNHDWSLVNHHNLCQTAFSYFSETHKGIFHDAFPVIKVKQRYRNRLPWLTQGLKNAIKHKNKLYRISMKYDTSFNKITYTQYKNKLTTILRKTEKDYYKCLLETNKNNLKKTWSIIRSVINNCKPSKLNESFLYNNSIITDKNEVSNKFNDYFVNVGKTLAAQIPKSGPSFHKYLPEANKECIFLIPTDEREIRNIILNVRNSAPGYDGISLKCIYSVIDTLVTPLTYITNLSLIEGIFPSELKIAQVLPLYKNNDPMIFNNYRPISLLPFFSKLFERLMYNRLIDFIEKHHLLYQFQFGFRKNHSTFMALVILLEKITEALDNLEFAICILIDFRKAFDTVEHNILLQKLYHYGIRGNALQWFNSYLSNRYQYVNYNNTSSDMKLITCGVLQGSILGPLLFLLYINDISSVSGILFSILFADDTTLFYSSKNLQELSDVINNELSKMMEWLNANRLSLNIDKTNFMIFRPKGKKEICPTIHINGSSIQEVDDAKFLGIIIDNKLNWIEHIRCISRKIAKGTGIIIKARKSFESETLLNLYNALIFPHITYSIHVWGTAAAVHLHRLHLFQKKIVRIICGVPPRTHTDPLYKDLKILNIDQIRDYSIALFIYKLSHHMLPSMFENMFIYTSDVHDYYTRQADLLYIQYAPTKRSQRTIKYYGTKLWNIISGVVQPDCAISTFKQKLKIFLLSWLG